MQLREAFTPVPRVGRIPTQAIDSETKDFEDAVQYYSAMQARSDCMLRRNPDDFPRTNDCPVLTRADRMGRRVERVGAWEGLVVVPTQAQQHGAREGNDCNRDAQAG